MRRKIKIEHRTPCFVSRTFLRVPPKWYGLTRDVAAGKKKKGALVKARSACMTGGGQKGEINTVSKAQRVDAKLIELQTVSEE